jgi:hypothetical protein
MPESYRIDRTHEPQPKRIDYDRMRREFPKQKRALTLALNAKSPVRVANACIAAVKVWDECGAWPDDWSAWQRALDDVLPYRQMCNLSDVAYGRVTITATTEED